MNDIRPSKKRPLGPIPSPQPPTPLQSVPTPGEPQIVPVGPSREEKPKKKHIVLWIIGGVIVLVLAVAASLIAWYKLSLQPVSNDANTHIRVEVTTGQSPAAIGEMLAEKKLIRSSRAFDIYTRLSGTRSRLQAGVYSLSPSESTEAIVQHIVSGKVDQFSITFLPGATLKENRQALIKAGYSATEVDAALEKTYDSPLFESKPSSANLEGYIYGETYKFDSDATVEEILTKTFDEFYTVVQKNNLVEGLKTQGLTLYQGITLASIIQREVTSPTDQKQAAQIFLKRFRSDMALGSDITAYYGADKLGVSRSVDVDTPYNTRIHTGLPPGPIAVPGLTALEAVASPASGDYLYFLSGDDDVTYFAHTDAEHEANIRDHCKIKCAIP